MKNTKIVRFVLISIMIVFTGLGFSTETLKGVKTEDLAKAVVVVKMYQNESDEQPVGEGTGFFIAKDRIVTNSHVIEGVARAQIETYDGDVYNVKNIFASDFKNDLVVLNLEKEVEDAKIIKISEKDAVPGDKIYTIGHPNGLYYTFSEGVVSAVRDEKGLENTVQMTVPISMGSSGGPVVNEDGELVGVVSFYLEGGQNLNFAISKEVLETMKEEEMELADYAMKAEDMLYKMINVAFFEIDEALSTGNMDQVYMIVEEFLGKYPENQIVKGFASEIYSMLGDYDSAYELVSSIDPIMLYEDSYMYFDMGEICYLAGHYEEAQQNLKKAIELKTNLSYAYKLLSECYQKLYKNEAALNTYKMGIYIFPQDAELKLSYLDFLIELEDCDQVLKAVEKYRADAEDNSFFIQEIKALTGKKDYSKALAKIETYENTPESEFLMNSYAGVEMPLDSDMVYDAEDLEEQNFIIMEMPMQGNMESVSTKDMIKQLKIECLYGIGDKAAAYGLLDELLEGITDDAAKLEIFKKAAEMKLSDAEYSDAKKYLTNALTLKYDDIETHEKLAVCYKELGKTNLYKGELKILEELKK